jgi:membrane dipeptidase
MLLIDAHLDLGWNALQWNRDLTVPAAVLRAQEAGQPGKARGLNTVCLPDLRRASAAVVFATVLARAGGRPIAHIEYPTPAQAYAAAQGQLAYYRALTALGEMQPLRTAAELNAHLACWQDAGADAASLPIGFVLAMEGADPILTPEQLPAWYADGLRILGPVHYGQGRYAGGTGTNNGLTDLGRRLLPAMQQLAIACDVTHLSDRAFDEVLDQFDGTLLASHHNARALVSNQRQLTDDQIRRLAARDAVIGVACDAWMLRPGWQITDRSDPRNPSVTLADVADHMAYICDLTGTVRHTAIGSDLDGGFGREQSPADLDTIADLQRLVDLLQQRGFSDDDVAAVFHGNWLRLLQRVLSAR